MQTKNLRVLRNGRLGSERMPKGHPRRDAERQIKTTVAIPLSLWQAAKHLAIEDATDLRAVVVAALKEYVGKRGRVSGPRPRS